MQAILLCATKQQGNEKYLQSITECRRIKIINTLLFISIRIWQNESADFVYLHDDSFMSLVVFGISFVCCCFMFLYMRVQSCLPKHRMYRSAAFVSYTMYYFFVLSSRGRASKCRYQIVIYTKMRTHSAQQNAHMSLISYRSCKTIVTIHNNELYDGNTNRSQSMFVAFFINLNKNWLSVLKENSCCQYLHGGEDGETKKYGKLYESAWIMGIL